MTAEEERDLRELSADLAGVASRPWQPRTISQAFATRGRGQLDFTLQVWIDLSFAESPLLLGELPENEAQTAAAFTAFNLALGTPEEAVLVCAAMQRAIDTAFAAALAMQPRNPAPAEEDDGFGDWAPTLACLVSQCGLSLAEALKTRVEQAFILIASVRRNEGWRVAGTPYAVRDLPDFEPTSTEEAAE